ncbi:LPXTG cell wall anchor domain-containing protein [Amedibacillus sp. YH-ame6]
MKKITNLIMSILVCATCALSPINATAGVDENEQAVLDILKSGINVNGKIVTIDSTYISQAESYFMRDDVSMNENQKSTIITQIESAKKIIIDNNVTNLATINKKYQDQIIDIAQTAASVMGVRISVDYPSKIITVIDKNGQVIFTAEKAIKNTGDDYTSILALSGAFAILLAGAGIVALKKGLLSKK